jgi:hypothetical protein
MVSPTRKVKEVEITEVSRRIDTEAKEYVIVYEDLLF